MEQFLIFYAPFIIVIVSILLAFWVAAKDEVVRKDTQKRN